MARDPYQKDHYISPRDPRTTIIAYKSEKKVTGERYCLVSSAMITLFDIPSQLEGKIWSANTAKARSVVALISQYTS